MTATPELTHELVEDIPILMYFMCTQLELDKAVDAVVPRHGNRQGLSWSQMVISCRRKATKLPTAKTVIHTSATSKAAT